MQQNSYKQKLMTYEGAKYEKPFKIHTKKGVMSPV